MSDHGCDPYRRLALAAAVACCFGCARSEDPNVITLLLDPERSLKPDDAGYWFEPAVRATGAGFPTE